MSGTLTRLTGLPDPKPVLVPGLRAPVPELGKEYP